jgi:hypothetical protein
MAKRRAPQNTSKNVKSALIPEKYHDYIYIGILILSVFIFFGDAIFGGVLGSADTLASKSFETYLNNADKEGVFPQWIPYIFGGMPSFAALLTTGDRMWDFIPEIFFGIMGLFTEIFGNDTARLAMYYVLYGIGMYFLMKSKKHERFVSFFTAVAAVFSTGVIVWVMIGHNTKPVVFAFFPWIFMFMEKVREKFSLIYSVLIAIAVHLMLEAGHVQMIFYGFLAFGIYLLFELISRLIKKDMPMSVIRAAVVLIFASGIAFMMSSDRYLSVMEYTPYSTRGSAPIEQNEQGNEQTESGGHDYEYATEWSFSPSEIKTFFIPNFYGFGKLDYSGPETRNQTVKIPSYWGQKIFEDVAPYMGIFVLFFAFVGAIAYRRNVFVQSLIALSIVALILSFGDTLPILYDLFYYNFPNFNKFRAPSMVLALVQFAVPILSGYGLSHMIKWRKGITDADKKMLRGLLIAAGAFLLFSFIYSAIFKETYINALASSDTGKRLPEAIHVWIYEQMINDWYVTAALFAAAVAAVWLFVKGKINNSVFYGMIGLFLIVDLWRVAYRPMEVQDKQEQDSFFRKTDLVQFLQKDQDVYRIVELDAFPSPNVPAFYELQSAGGYHSAKLRVWQDMMDVADNGNTRMPTNPMIWSLMNVKYILTNQQQQGLQAVFQSQQTGQIVYQNPYYLPRVFFVDSVAKKDPLDILKSIKDFNFKVREVAYVEEDIKSNIDKPMENASAKVAEFDNHKVVIEAEATGNNFLYISEMHYPPGWTAYIDGKETEIIKTNYAFRGIIVPKGKHKIEMKYHSDAFQTGKILSTVANIGLVLVLGLGIFLERKRLKTKENDEEKPKE